MEISLIYLNAIQSVLKNSLLAEGLQLTVLPSPTLERAEKLAAANFPNLRQERVFSIFHRLGGAKKSEPLVLPKNPISISEKSFPQKEPGDESLAMFKKDFEKLPTEPLAQAETLLFLLQKYATGLPSGYAEQISLFDFAKIKAAVAVCLHENPEEKLMLIGGSVSGVQTFLFDIISKNAAKNLKGRSFYMHLLADSAVFSLLKKLALPRANVIYSSGGSFFILAPNSDATRSAYQSWKKDTLDWFFKTHNLRLFLETDFVKFEAEQLLKNQLPEIFKSLHDELSKDKKHPFTQQLLDNFGKLFEPHGDGGEAARDVITGEELVKIDQVPFERDADGKPINYISRQTDDIKNLGNSLRKTNFWVTSNAQLGNSNFLVNIEQAGVWQTLFESYPQGKLPAGSLIRQFNEFNYEGADAASGFEYYGGNDQPYVELKHDIEPKTFSELAGAPDKDRKNDYKKDPPWPDLEFKRLAVLRMDVDGLGKIFQEGFPSLAHYSALSRSFDWFFKGHLNNIWENGAAKIGNDYLDKPDFFRFKDWTQILYAGGDDLFLVGRWDCLLDFSFKIQQAFHRYVCENEILGLSGGISLVTHKYPIMKAAEQAGAAESKAKRHYKEIEGKKGEFHFKKNSFNLLGRSLQWQTEFEIAQSLKTRLVEARRMPQKPMPQSVLMKIAAFNEQRELQKRNGEPPSWKWRIAYDLTRARERAKGNPTVSALIDEIVVSIFTNRSMQESSDEKNARAHEFYDLLMVAIRWAELELRHRRALEKGQKQD
jgi:CRISPR-associated protein Csm1